jgi:site-specific DNA recombinase
MRVVVQAELSLRAMLRVVLYCRVSTEEQAKLGFSVAEQLHTLRAHAAAQGFEVVAEVLDEG